jgi:hypothetical protein
LQNEAKAPREESIMFLLAIFKAAWALVLFGTVMIFEFIVPLNLFQSFFLNSIIKGVLTTILVGIWLLLFLEMRNAMVRNQLKIEKKAGTSP